jgi:hypothetical protein
MLLVLSLGLVAGVLADFILVLPPVVRWALWVSWIVAGLALAVFGLLRPYLRRSSWTDLAALARRVRPEVGESLVGAVDLVEHAGRDHGSPQLIAALVEQADERSRGVDFSAALPAGPSRRRLLMGVAAVAFVALPPLIQPDPFAALARRFLAPWFGMERVGRYIVHVRGGDRIVAIGDELPVVAEVRPRYGSAPPQADALLMWSEADGTHHTATMVPEPLTGGGARHWNVTLPRVARSLRFRVVSGAARSREVAVRAIEAPAIARLSARVEPPPYTHEAPFLARDPGRIEAREGSTVELRIATNRPLRLAAVNWPSPKLPRSAEPAPSAQTQRTSLQRADEAGRSWTVRLPAVVSGSFTFTLEDASKLRSRDDPSRRLLVRPDLPPTIAWLDPVAVASQARADDTLLIGIEARDDLAVAGVELHYVITRGETEAPTETGRIAARLPGIGTDRARGDAALDLRPLKLRPGDTVGYRLQAADNREPEPNVTWTDDRRLSIVAQADPLAARRDAAERAALQKVLDELKRDAAANRKATESLRYAADAANRPDGRWDAAQQQSLRDREQAQRDLIDRLHLFARALAESRRFARLARPTRQVADVEAETGRIQLDDAARSPGSAQRLDELKRADATLAAVVARLEDLQRKFEDLSRIEDHQRRLADLAARQDELAKKTANSADSLTGPADRARLDEAEAMQERLSRELDELVQRSPELKAEALEAQAQDAEDLARQARKLADRQREAARRTADLPHRREELRALAEAQKALEDDARRLAVQVDPPLAENGRGRLNTNAVARPIEPLTRGDLEQSHQHLSTAELELARLARDLADVRHDPKALARRLSQRQEQLRQQVNEAVRGTVPDVDEPKPDERKALSQRLSPLFGRQEAIARLAESLPEPAETQDAKPRAIERLEAALNGLRDPKPSKVDAWQGQARDALQHLADLLPDPQQQRAQVRQQIEEARRRTHEVVNEMERHLRETGPTPGRPFDKERAASELANRVAPLAPKAAEAAAVLKSLDVEARLLPQQARAVQRTETLSHALAQPRREALPALAADARAALDRLAVKADGFVPNDDAAAEVASDLARLVDGQAPADGLDRRAESRRIVAAVRGLDVPDARLLLEETALAGESLAQAIGDERADNDREALLRAARAASDLACRLAGTLSASDEIDALARVERSLKGRASSRDPVGSARIQRTIRDDLARIRHGTDWPDEAAAREAAAAVERSIDVSDRLPRPSAPAEPPRPRPDALTEAQAEAADRLDALARTVERNVKLAQNTDPPSPPRVHVDDPELGLKPSHVAAAEELARRQRRIRERLQSLLSERVPEQEAIREDARALARRFSDVRYLTRELSPRGQGPSNAAAALLGNEAPPVMDQSTGQLTQGQPTAARETQRRAAEILERAAQQAEDLVGALRADAPGDGGDPQEAGSLADAQEAQRQAAQELAEARESSRGGEAARSASQQMSRAADSLRQAAQQRQGSESLAQSGEPEDVPSPDSQSRPAGQTEADLAQLQDMIRRRTGRRWGELPGHLRTEILQMSQGRYRDDYARLIQLYFREIAAAPLP